VYRCQPVIASVIDKLSRRVSTLPFEAYRKVGDTRELVAGDALDSLIRRPMPRRTTVQLNAHVMQSMLIHGNALLAKVRTGDRESPPSMLWPLDWAQVSGYGQPGGTIEWWSTTQFENTERFIAAEDTIHFAWPAPDGSEIGVSPLEKLRVTVALENALLRHQTAMFKNGTRPSLAVSLEDEHPGADKLEYARKRVETMHKGPDNAGKTFFMGANVKVQPLSLSPVEVALIEQRKLNLGEIGMVFDLAGPLMGDMEHGTYSNVEELLRSLYRDVVPPWTSLIEGTYQAQLLDPEPAWLDRSVCFDLSDKLRGDPLELAQSLKLQVEAGLITRNEARRILHMPPIADDTADSLTMNVNNQAPIDGAMTVPPAGGVSTPEAL
jgi:HK97 family phage portal protein